MSESHTRNHTAEWLNCLQANGYRLTAPRRVVVETLASSQRILSPLDVYESARERYPGLGLVTVYRTIEKLEELGLLQRVHQTSGCHGFISAFSGHQHLLICQECGLVEFFSGEDENIYPGDGISQPPRQTTGPCPHPQYHPTSVLVSTGSQTA